MSEGWLGGSQVGGWDEGASSVCMHLSSRARSLWLVWHPPVIWGSSHKQSKCALWLNNGQKPAWVDSYRATRGSGMKRSPENVCTSGQGALGWLASHLEVAMCRKLCEDGRISDAVDALNLLVQRGRHVPNNIFYRVLKGCIAHKDLVLGRRIHDLTIQSGYGGDSFLASHLIGLYASHGRLEEAMRVFTNVCAPNAYNWAAITFAYARHGQAAQAIQLYRQMLGSAVKPNDHIYVAVLKACAGAGDLVAGKEVHAQILMSKGEPSIFVQTGLVGMYAKCGSLEDARRVFERLSQKDVVTWNAMIAGYTQQGMGQEALSLHDSMQKEGLNPPSRVTFVCLLQACANIGVGALSQGKHLHAQIEERGLQDDKVIVSSLVNMYAKCGSVEDAGSLFDTVTNRDVVTWTALIAGYAQQGMGQKALSLYDTMHHEGLAPPDSVTFVCLLQACAMAGVGALRHGKQLHAQISEHGLQDDVVLGGSLVNMYAKCGSLGDARSVFDGLSHKNVATWNSMLAGYARQGLGGEALTLYDCMQQQRVPAPDSFTFASLLQACASVGAGALRQGRQLHAQTEELGLRDDAVVGGCLVNMYAKCGSLEEAHTVFDRLPYKNVVAWNAILAAYADQGMGHKVLSLYSSMTQEDLAPPDAVTFVCLLQSCALLAALPLGKKVHLQVEEQGLQTDPVVGAALVNMYAKCGSMPDSQQVFDSLSERSMEAWGALTSGYARQGASEAMFDLLDRMRKVGVQPNGPIFLSVLTVCSHAGLVDKGRMYFAAMATVYGISPTVEHYRCIIDLLGRAGHLDEALEMARSMPFSPSGAAVWHTILGSCRKWNNVEIGQKAFEFAVTLDGQDTASYVLMSNIYASAQRWEESRTMQIRRVESGAWKAPGKSWWTDMGGVVHTFFVAEKGVPGGAAGMNARKKMKGRQTSMLFEGAVSAGQKDCGPYILMFNIAEASAEACVEVQVRQSKESDIRGKEDARGVSCVQGWHPFVMKERCAASPFVAVHA